MPRVERTREDRDFFYGQRNEILDALADVDITDRKTQKEENEKTMIALKSKLEDCDNLVGTCSHLANLVMRQEAAKMGPGKDSLHRNVTPKDMDILGAGLKALLGDATAKAPKDSEGRPEYTDMQEIIRLRKALSRVKPVQLFYAAFWGDEKEPFRYTTREPDRNGIDVSVYRKRYFGGIPEDKRPIKKIPVKRDNITEFFGKIDFGIYPENAQKIYKILQDLEREQPVVNIPLKPGDKSLGRCISRAGEAEFFLKHLPKGLKPWAEATQA